MKSSAVLLLIITSLMPCPAAQRKQEQSNALDQYIQEAKARAGTSMERSSGSLWSPNAGYSDLGIDLRASRVDDIVTILVVERASAVTKGTVRSSRASKANAGIGAIGIIPRAASPLPNLARMSSEATLDGEGATSRETALTAALTARVVDVLPNGYLVVEGSKRTAVNSEQQTVTVRGIVRPVDLSPNNSVHSDRVAQMEIFLNGKGVVGDAVRRPFILYRILLGLLPF